MLSTRQFIARLLGLDGQSDFVRGAGLAHLEPRQLLSAAVVDDIDDISVNQNSAPTVVELANRYNDTALNGSIVKFQSVLGTFHALLFDSAVTATVNNFLRYVDGGLYDDTIVHRSVPGRLLQGGAFGNVPNLAAIPSFPPVVNQAGLNNIRGTLAMDKLSNAPTVSTSRWFVNVDDNPELNTAQGGYTVFGRIIGDGMTVVDALNAVPVFNFTNPAELDSIPLRSYTSGQPITTANTVAFSDVSRADKFTYTVTSADPTLVSARIIDGRLSLSYLTNRSGTTTVTVRATAVDSTEATPNFVEDTFTVNVVALPPTLGGVDARERVVGQSGTITLRAQDALDSDRQVERVQYWFDLDGNGTFDADQDQFIVASTDRANSFRASFQAAGFGLGTHTFFARAQDSDNLFSNVVQTTVRVDAFAPTIGGVRASVAVLPAPGAALTLSASSARDQDGTITLVQYYLDNGDGVFDASTDSLLGSSNTPSKFTFSVDTTALNPGTYTFFARAQDNATLFSLPAATTIRINAVPTIADLTPSAASVERLAFFDLTASGVTDDGVIRTVNFHIDVDGNGAFDPAIDRIVARGRRDAATGNWTGRVSTRGFNLGETTFFAVATDADRGTSSAASASVTVTNAAPTISGVAGSPLVIANQGDTLRLSARSPKDRDGTISLVQYFRDDGDGVFDAEADSLLGESTARGFALSVSTSSFSVGTNTIFARARDNAETFSSVVSSNVSLNAPPAIEQIVPPDTGTVVGQPFTIAARGVGDSDGTVTSVTFYLDLNGDGEFQVTDRVLGNGRLSSAGVYSLTTTARSITPGVYSVFARATDNRRGISAIAEGEITFT
jgi:peptidyl-prolyl cis-trans isomerase A (cyclophilin A)